MICKNCGEEMEFKSSDDEMDFCYIPLFWNECPKCGESVDCDGVSEENKEEQ